MKKEEGESAVLRESESFRILEIINHNVLGFIKHNDNLCCTANYQLMALKCIRYIRGWTLEKVKLIGSAFADFKKEYLNTQKIYQKTWKEMTKICFKKIYWKRVPVFLLTKKSCNFYKRKYTKALQLIPNSSDPTLNTKNFHLTLKGVDSRIYFKRCW